MRGEHRQVAIELLEEAAVKLGAHDEKLDEIAKERVEEAAQILGMTMAPTSKETDNAIQKAFDLFDEIESAVRIVLMTFKKEERNAVE